MSDYGFTITDKGRFLIAKLATGVKLELTKTMVGSGRPVDCAAREMTDLSEPVAEATSTVPTYVDDRVDMIVEYRSDLNGGLKRGFWLNEFGIYAVDPDVGEILLYYGCLGDYPQWVSAASKTGVDVRRFPVSIIIGYGADVDTNYCCEAWMTAEDVSKYCTDVMLPELLGEAKKLIEQHNSDKNAHHAGIIRQDIIIPTTGWVQSDPEEYEGLSVDIPVEGVTGDMIPIVIVPPKQIKVIGERKFSPCVKSDDGYIRLYSKASPPEPINATLVLLITSGGATGGGSYQLPTASADKLGGVKIGENINVTDDGTISVNSEELVSDIVASDEDAEEVITRYFGKT